MLINMNNVPQNTNKEEIKRGNLTGTGQSALIVVCVSKGFTEQSNHCTQWGWEGVTCLNFFFFLILINTTNHLLSLIIILYTKRHVLQVQVKLNLMV